MSPNESGKREGVEKACRRRKHRRGSKANIDYHVQLRKDINCSMDKAWDHPTYTGHHQLQPLSEEYAVCGLICVAHIVGSPMSIHKGDDGHRDMFDAMASTIQDSHNDSGHYHISVVARVLREHHQLKFTSVLIPHKPTPARKDFMLDLLSGPQQQDATYFFQATIVLTEKSLKVAHKHFVVVKVFREQSAVLLDGLFNVPKLFCMNVLKRYTQIDSLYRVVNLDVAL
mmetsp:Transcript_69408/g.136211  ORF Transcript_69408/g.136211 Transcript_69408/m.136211 type:complete len:228 (-) Transcript_69408:80-763(-)|eukprot:CAMPEP_0170376652 /NCGR_PEP_ID=MMETSP0117_2-20130122/11839_1 /TAXON_ID=400756 /ORGANISM="Durinskia baltica, Strain CSIRO CS-38" /LENGTH=227 /DNA_ID=CAMNT_0010631869 /DNA_START=83 /DNA_END=766 /DNA_ORIENTATION=+